MKVTFVDYYLTSTDKAMVKEIDMSPEKMCNAIQDIAQTGYKVSVSFDAKNEAYWVSLTGKDRKMPNYAKCLSIPHADVETAVAAHVMLLDIIGMDSSWEDLSEENPSPYNW